MIMEGNYQLPVLIAITVLLVIAYPFLADIKSRHEVMVGSSVSDVEVQNLLDIFKSKSMDSSCQGVFAYYTGKNFITDAVNMKQAYLNSHGKGCTKLDEGMVLLPPMAMTYSSDKITCVQFAHWVGCLGSMYPGVRCEPNLNENLTHIYQVCTEQIGNMSYKITL